jgi:hypothetical protein
LVAFDHSAVAFANAPPAMKLFVPPAARIEVDASRPAVGRKLGVGDAECGGSGTPSASAAPVVTAIRGMFPSDWVRGSRVWFLSVSGLSRQVWIVGIHDLPAPLARSA